MPVSTRDLIRELRRQGAEVRGKGPHVKVYKGGALICVMSVNHDTNQGGDKTHLGIRARLRRAGFRL